MKIYISASWKQRKQVRELAHILRHNGHQVFDFTDPSNRKTPEAPPEQFPDKFDPSQHVYSEYLNKQVWRDVVYENREAIKDSDLIIMLLPCGIDATADWALGVGMNKRTIIVGQPLQGNSSEVHLWADAILEKIDDILPWINSIK